MQFALMSEPHDRLRIARTKAGYPDAATAADAMGVPQPTYFGHENGNRGLSRAAARYAQFFGVSLDWLLRNKGPMIRTQRADLEQGNRRTVPLVGYVGAGAAAHFFAQDQGPLDEVDAPEGSTEQTVAVEIRGESLGTIFDRWLVFYDNVQRPMTNDLVGKLCVVGLADGRILIKKVQRSRTRGLFHLVSQTEAPILDAEIEWAARVRLMMAR